MTSKPISLIINYARSGGTLLNKYLHNIDNLVVLSESHPIHSTMMRKDLANISIQAKEWYGINVKSSNYIDQIFEIKNWCDENNKYLVIRDWSYIDFTESWENYNNPPYKSVNLELLEKRFDVRKIAFVRDSIDVYLSRGVKINKFSRYYLKYVQFLLANKIKIFKYEDFCINPEKELDEILKELNITENGAKTLKLFSNKVVGDINFSRGNQLDTIVVLPRKYTTFFNKYKINNDLDLNYSNKLLNYPTYYESCESENIIDFIKLKIKYIRKKLIKGF